MLPLPIPAEAALLPPPPFEQQLNLVDVMGGEGGGGGRGGGEMLSLQPARINRPNRGWIERERERGKERAAYIT